MAFNDGIKAGPIAFIGLVSVLVTFALVLLLQVLYFEQRNALLEADLAKEISSLDLVELTPQQQDAITDAKEQVVAELAGGKLPDQVIGPISPAAGAEAATPDAADVDEGEGEADATAEATDQPQPEQESQDDDKT